MPTDHHSLHVAPNVVLIQIPDRRRPTADALAQAAATVEHHLRALRLARQELERLINAQDGEE